MPNETEHHYYAACGTGWATGKTLQGAINKLAASERSSIRATINRVDKRGEPGCYIWTCRVELPDSATYGIERFMPLGAPISQAAHRYITWIPPVRSKQDTAFYTPADDICSVWELHT